MNNQLGQRIEIVIIPDFVGYILIVIGLGMLSPLHLRFKKARIFAAIMILLSLGDFLKLKDIAFQHGNFTYWLETLFAITPIGTILDLIMVWHICGGIIELAAASENRHLAQVGTTRRNLYLVLTAIGWCCAFLFVTMPRLISTPVITLLFVFGIVVMCLMMGLMKRASEELS